MTKKEMIPLMDRGEELHFEVRYAIAREVSQ